MTASRKKKLKKSQFDYDCRRKADSVSADGQFRYYQYSAVYRSQLRNQFRADFQYRANLERTPGTGID
jgi:hypothetical protein